jgi:hypothetical protein
MKGPIDPVDGVEPIAVPFSRLLSTLRRHLWVLILTGIFGIGTTACVTEDMPKEYTSQAAIIIEPQRTQVSDLQAISSDNDDDTSLMRTQIGNTPPLLAGRGQVVVIHDAGVFDTPTSYSWKFRLWYKGLQRPLARAGAHIATVSEFSRQRIAGQFALVVGSRVAHKNLAALAADLRARGLQRAGALSWVASARKLANVVESLS